MSAETNHLIKQGMTTAQVSYENKSYFDAMSN